MPKRKLMNNQALEISVSEWVGKRENFNVFICVFLIINKMFRHALLNRKLREKIYKCQFRISIIKTADNVSSASCVSSKIH